MKLLKIIFVLGFFILQVEVGLSQNHSPKIAIVNQVDSMVTHVYADPWHNMKKRKDVFDYGAYSVKELISKFDGSNIEAIELETPIWFNKVAYINFFGKPSRQFKAWLTSLKRQHDIDYLIVVLHKWNPDPNINFQFINGIHYGIVTYATNQNAVTLFSLVGYYIFATGTFDEITLNPNHDRYVITNVGLLDRLSFRETMKLPDKYYKLCKDKMRNVADTRNAEIWRVMLKEIGE